MKIEEITKFREKEAKKVRVVFPEYFFIGLYFSLKIFGESFCSNFL